MMSRGDELIVDLLHALAEVTDGVFVTRDEKYGERFVERTVPPFIVAQLQKADKVAHGTHAEAEAAKGIGGVFFATLAFMVYGIVLHYIPGAPTPHYTILTVLGIILSIVSQMGDLSASLLKREKGIKDFGVIFPGHGGVLDRFDGLIFASVFIYFVVALF